MSSRHHKHLSAPLIQSWFLLVQASSWGGQSKEKHLPLLCLWHKYVAVVHSFPKQRLECICHLSLPFDYFFFYLWNSSTSSAVPLAMPTPVTWQLHKYWCETDRNCWFIYLNIASTYSNNSEVVHHLNSFIPSFISPRDFSVLFGRKCVFYSLVPHTCTGNLFSFAGNRLIVKVLKVNEKI